MESDTEILIINFILSDVSVFFFVTLQTEDAHEQNPINITSCSNLRFWFYFKQSKTDDLKIKSLSCYTVRSFLVFFRNLQYEANLSAVG